MESIEDPHNILGMGSILADDDEDINIDDIEKSISTGETFTSTSQSVDLAEQYGKDLESMSRLTGTNTSSTIKDPFAGSGPGLIDGLDEGQSSSSLDNIFIGSPTKKSTPVTNDEYTIHVDEGLDNTAIHSSSSNYVSSSYSSDWSSSKPRDTQLQQMTAEERKQSHLNKVFSDMDVINDDMKFVEEEEKEDDIARMLEQIDLLRTNLTSEGVDLTRIQEVDQTNTRKEIRGVLRILQIKNDRLRYCDMFEEGILAAAYALESVFDGKKEYFGTKIDLVGWSDTVKVKLHRMRYDTSSFVSNIMKGYNIGHGWRIVFELLPSLFLYSRDRRLRSRDNLISDRSYTDAIIELQQNRN